MDSKSKSNRIGDIVRLQRILKKWKSLPKTTSSSSSSSSSITTSKSIKFLKKTLSFSDPNVHPADQNGVVPVPKGRVAVCVGKELKRFVIPTEYLRHQAFGILLREAEEEFGFQQEGVLKIPCEVTFFEKILKMVQEKREFFFLHELGFNADDISSSCTFSPDLADQQLAPPPTPQLCV